MSIDTVHEVVGHSAGRRPEARAILGLGEVQISYERLQHHIQATIARLNALGIGRGDRVAAVLPNGPTSAAAFLSISSATAIAPLNPNYTEKEFDFYLSDLKPRALVVEAGSKSPAVDAARARGIALLEVRPPQDAQRALFDLSGEPQGGTSAPGPALPSDVGLVLHTSGTTSRPKIVPLTHRNLCASARSIAGTLMLTEEDRCLNVMPLFHIHGLMAAVLATMTAGASVACTPGFLRPEFLKWMSLFQPTWYTAVPTMHQAILAEAEAHKAVIAAGRLRFIRSSSASLAPQVMQDLERIFQVPVIEAYGMTEASHQMASNPLPPRPRKPGSVGVPAGPEVSILLEGQTKPNAGREPGEIVIRGPSVTSGYAENPDANERAFTDGWFRTGDQGYFDDDGYLFISGRLKEIINRGGEKISPREVDEIFLEHPAVAQAVTFALPDARLGEAVAIALVLKDKTVTAEALQEYASSRLAFFKVPEKVVILDEVPKGATGKVQRIGLAEKLGLTEAKPPAEPETAGYLAPRTETESRIAAIWQDVLGRAPIGVDQTFRSVGGDSMLATIIHMRIESELGVKVPLAKLYRLGTVAAQAELLGKLKRK